MIEQLFAMFAETARFVLATPANAGAAASNMSPAKLSTCLFHLPIPPPREAPF